jgi:mono/diheme cytochrome c family protein
MLRLTAIALALSLAACATPEPAPQAVSASTQAIPPQAVPMPLPAKTARRADSPGGYAFSYRCAGCHNPATPGAPLLVQLEAMRPETIVAALTTGRMKLMAIDMPETEARDIAAWLTSEVIPQRGDMPAAWP